MKKITLILLTVVLGIALMVPATVIAASVEPVEYADNPTCDDLECCDAEYSYKWNEDPDGDGPDLPPLGDPAEGARNGTIVTPDGATITIANADGTTFDWVSDSPVSCVIVKGGPVANVYCYDEPVYSDTGMVAPTNPANSKPYDVSHVIFCYDGNGGSSGGNGEHEVGGTVYPVNKAALLAPWIVLAVVALAGTFMIVRRSRVHS